MTCTSTCWNVRGIHLNKFLITQQSHLHTEAYAHKQHYEIDPNSIAHVIKHKDGGKQSIDMNISDNEISRTTFLFFTFLGSTFAQVVAIFTNIHSVIYQCLTNCAIQDKLWSAFWMKLVCYMDKRKTAICMCEYKLATSECQWKHSKLNNYLVNETRKFMRWLIMNVIIYT